MLIIRKRKTQVILVTLDKIDVQYVHIFSIPFVASRSL